MYRSGSLCKSGSYDFLEFQVFSIPSYNWLNPKREKKNVISIADVGSNIIVDIRGAFVYIRIEVFILKCLD